MCLLLTHPASTVFDKADIADFYSHNQDGVGVMWAENDILYVQKALPKNADEAYQFYLDYCLGKECVVHWRLKTHGLIDLKNCHPYEVFGDGSERPMYMMHNGVLHTGNAKDKNLSDTWHYIEDYIKPLLLGNTELVFSPAFIEIIEAHISSGNKFVFMDHTGRTAIVNEQQFVTYKGAKLSNTYAWSAHKGGHGGGWGKQYAWPEDDDLLALTSKYHKPKSRPTPMLAYLPETSDRDAWVDAVYDQFHALKFYRLEKSTTTQDLELMWNIAGEEYCWEWVDSFEYYSAMELEAELEEWKNAALIQETETEGDGHDNRISAN